MFRRWCDTSILTLSGGRSLTRSLAAYVQRTGVQLSPRLQGMAATALVIAEPVLSKVISPEALSEFLTTGRQFGSSPRYHLGRLGSQARTWSMRGKSLQLPSMGSPDTASRCHSRYRQRTGSPSRSSYCDGTGN